MIPMQKESIHEFLETAKPKEISNYATHVTHLLTSEQIEELSKIFKTKLTMDISEQETKKVPVTQRKPEMKRPEAMVEDKIENEAEIESEAEFQRKQKLTPKQRINLEFEESESESEAEPKADIKTEETVYSQEELDRMAKELE